MFPLLKAPARVRVLLMGVPLLSGAAFPLGLPVSPTRGSPQRQGLQDRGMLSETHQRPQDFQEPSDLFMSKEGRHTEHLLYTRHSTGFICSPHKNCKSRLTSHFTDEETEAQRHIMCPRLAQLVRDPAGVQTQTYTWAQGHSGIVWGPCGRV